MTAKRSEFPPDISGCYALIERQQAESEQQQRIIEQQQRTIEEQQATLANLSVDMQLLKRALFGSRRERFIDDPRQGYLFESNAQEGTASESEDSQPEAPETEEPPSDDKTRRRSSHGRRPRVFPECLPRKPQHHTLSDEDIPEELRNDPQAKRFFKKTSEQLEFEPASLYVIEHYQEVIVTEDAHGETTMATAPKPRQLIDAYTGPGFWAYLTASRFADHLPYYRLEDILSRHQFRIDRSTQWRWMSALSEGVKPLVDLMRRRALLSRVLGVDETPVTMLSPGVSGSVKTYLWDTIGDGDYPYDCFYFTTNRSRAGPDAFLSNYRGYLQSDAYICYERLSARNRGIIQVSCWAHARRKFDELNHTAPNLRTHMALAYFQRLYDIEDRGRALNELERHELRQQESRPIVNEFHEWLLEQQERELPKSKLRSAIAYMTGRWDSFARYLECAAIPIDNNRTEAALKYAILGRKAWLFFGNERGGETAARLFTLTKSCNRHRIDPFAYLRDVYRRLPSLTGSQLESLLPDRWIVEHPEHLIQERVDEAQQRARRTRERRAERRRLLQCGI